MNAPHGWSSRCGCTAPCSAARMRIFFAPSLLKSAATARPRSGSNGARFCGRVMAASSRLDLTAASAWKENSRPRNRLRREAATRAPPRRLLQWTKQSSGALAARACRNLPLADSRADVSVGRILRCISKATRPFRAGVLSRRGMLRPRRSPQADRPGSVQTVDKRLLGDGGRVARPTTARPAR